MKTELNERITIDHDEMFNAHKASALLDEIYSNMNAKEILDNQEFPDVIEALLIHALLVENTRVYSVFNLLDDDTRKKVLTEIMNRKDSLFA